MHQEGNACHGSWGARINTTLFHRIRDYPDWVNPRQRDKWAKKGLIVWESQTQLVVRLTASQALHVMDQLRSDNTLKEHGIVIGEPVTRLVIGEPEQEPEEVLSDPIHLSARRTKALLRLLERNEKRLERMQEREREERSCALGNVFGILLDLAVQKDRSEATDDGAS